jgi:pyridoxine 5-phosphate synthase
MTRLSVNVNKIATLRNSRGGNMPDVLQVALDIERFGAQGITVHPRPDGRHIRIEDVYELKQNIKCEFNIEGYPSPAFIQLIRNVRPEQVTLVPDAPDVLTSNAGWRVRERMEELQAIIQELKLSGARISLFIDPFDYQESDLGEVAATGADAIELYTEAYAKTYNTLAREEVAYVYDRAANHAREHGLRVNAGHDLNLENLQYLLTRINCIDEVSIGHALICDALYLGLEETVKRYLACCNP